MSNMSYCRFTNTLEDLQDCYLHIDDDIDSPNEKKARQALIALCVDIADDYRDDD